MSVCVCEKMNEGMLQSVCVCVTGVRIRKLEMWRKKSEEKCKKVRRKKLLKCLASRRREGHLAGAPGLQWRDVEDPHPRHRHLETQVKD